ncbi:MAG: heavy metal-binding domain-containing protein [Candidatus Dormibacteraeota bacterium]|nr:heavy metal-binding domain-containing protein [Candidatus Dormibacteraeota bacterium]
MAVEHSESVLVTTTERPVGYEVVLTLGQVFGVVVRSRGLGANIVALVRTLGGGEITEFTRLVEDTRRHAIDRMVENARAMGANAVIMMRFDSSEMGQSMAEVVAYGTAAVVERAG